MNHADKIDKNIPKMVERSDAYFEIMSVLGSPLDDFKNLLTLKGLLSHVDTAGDIELELIGKSYDLTRFELESDAKFRAKLQQTRLFYQEMGSKRYIIDRLNEIIGVQNAYIRDIGDWGWLLGYSVLGYDTILDSGVTQPFAIKVYLWYDESVIDALSLTSKVENYLKKMAPAGAEWLITCKNSTNWTRCPGFVSAGTNAAFNFAEEGILEDIPDPVFVSANTPVEPVITTVSITAGIQVRVREIYSNLYYEISYDQGESWTEPKLVFLDRSKPASSIYYTKNPNLEVITGAEGIKRVKITFNRFNFDTWEWDKWEGYLKLYVFVSDLVWLEQEFVGAPIYFDANTLKSVLDRNKIRYIMRTATKLGGAGGLGFGLYDFGEDFFGEGSGMRPDDSSPDGWTNWQQVWKESSMITSFAAIFGVQFGIVIEDMSIDKQKFWHKWFTVKKY